MYVGVKQLFNKVKSSLLPSFGSYISESKTYFLPLIYSKIKASDPFHKKKVAARCAAMQRRGHLSA